MQTFMSAIAGIRHWFRQHDMFPDDDGQAIKITIEVPTPTIAAAVLCQLKTEIDPVGMHGPFAIDIDKPMRLMGMQVTFNIKDAQPLPSVYWRGLPSFLRRER